MSAMKKVLVVDDEAAILKVVAKRLETAGFAVSVAMDGEAALAHVRRDPPDLVILDLMLPKVNGFDVCTTIKQHPDFRRIPVVIFTAKTGEQDYWKGMECGADAYLTKPFTAEDLTLLVNRLIEAISRPGAAAPEMPNAGA